MLTTVLFVPDVRVCERGDDILSITNPNRNWAELLCLIGRLTEPVTCWTSDLSPPVWYKRFEFMSLCSSLFNGTRYSYTIYYHLCSR